MAERTGEARRRADDREFVARELENGIAAREMDHNQKLAKMRAQFRGQLEAHTHMV